MSLNVAVALVVGCVLGVFATVVLIGMALAVREKQMMDFRPEQDEKEETETHE